MKKVKILYNEDWAALESAINGFISKKEVKLIDVKYSASGFLDIKGFRNVHSVLIIYCDVNEV